MAADGCAMGCIVECAMGCIVFAAGAATAAQGSGEPSTGGREAAAGAGCGIGATEEEFPLEVPSAASSIIMEESTAGIATSTSPGATVGSETPPKGGWAWRTGMGPAILKGWPPAMGGGGMGATSGMPLNVTELAVNDVGFGVPRGV